MITECDTEERFGDCPPFSEVTICDLNRRYTEGNNMTQKVPNPPPGFDALTFDEKLDYVQSLWDRIAAKPDSVPVPDWHLEVIEQRLNAGPHNARPWNEVRYELQARLRERKPPR